MTLLFVGAVSGCINSGSAIPRVDPTPHRLTQSVQASYEAHPDSSEFNVLILSSGGQFGAFGAGAFNSLNAASQRKYDIVCGSSIGAVMASHAFLAHLGDSPSSAGQLRDFFVESNQRSWYRKKWILELILYRNALYNTRRLRQHIQSLVTREVFDTVGDEARKNPGRRIFVTTTNADQGYVQYWDLTRIAVRNEPGDYELYIDTLVAAAAVPMFFPPKFSDNSEFRDSRSGGYAMQIDGGIRAPLFFRPILEEIPAQGGKAVHVVIIQNGYFRAPSIRVGGNFLAHLPRTIDLMVAEIRKLSLHQIAHTIRSHLGGTFQYTYVPDNFELSTRNENGLSFNQNTMRRLYQAGTEAKWVHESPRDIVAGPYPFE